MHDLVIVGGGPAGVAAGIYAARKKIKTALVTDGFGGQSLVSNDIQNWIGVKSASGFEIAKMMEEHLRAQEGIEVVEPDRVTKITDRGDRFLIETKQGKKIEACAILVTSGSRRRKLGVPGEEAFNGKGVMYCTTCDAPLFKDKIVAVVGGGNAGLEGVVDLLPYAAKVYLFERNDFLRGDPITQEKVKASEKVEMRFNTEILEIVGDGFVSGLRYKNLKTGEIVPVKLDGVFVEIGSVPNSDIVNDLVKTNAAGEIVVDHKTQATSHPRIWAAGDVTDVLYKQNNISMGDGVKAALNIYEYLNKNKPS